MELEFYRVKQELIDYYYGIDDRVMNNYGGKRMYIGILINISEFKYILPLSSPKDNDYNRETGELKRSTFTIFRLEDFKNDKEKAEYLSNISHLVPYAKIIDHKTTKNLGKVFLANMIPVTDEDITYVDISKEEKKYGILLQKQYEQIKKIKRKIITYAKIVYEQKNNEENYNNINYLKSCCDFKKLEEARKKV